MKEFWNERYALTEYVYGTEPNDYYKHTIHSLLPGKALFPAEGEGRNAVFAAQLGWEVTAFDQSSSAKKKKPCTWRIKKKWSFAMMCTM